MTEGSLPPQGEGKDGGVKILNPLIPTFPRRGKGFFGLIFCETWIQLEMDAKK